VLWGQALIAVVEGTRWPSENVTATGERWPKFGQIDSQIWRPGDGPSARWAGYPKPLIKYIHIYTANAGRQSNAVRETRLVCQLVEINLHSQAK